MEDPRCPSGDDSRGGAECTSSSSSSAVFWSRSQGVYFSYKYQEWRLMACRAALRLGLVALVLILYAVLWFACAECIYWLAGISCAATVLGGSFMAPACVAGIAASLLKGIRLGTGPFHFDMHWDI